MQNAKGWAAVIGFLVIVAIGVFVMVHSVQQTTQNTLQPFQQANQSLQTQVSSFLHPTPTILPDPITIVQEVRDLARLESIQYSVEKVISAEFAQGPFAFLFGDKLLFVAHGTVVAGVDLGKLTEQDIKIQNGTLIVRLPPAEIFTATLDNHKSYVFNRTTGVLSHGDVNLETSARQAAEDEIRRAALEDGILNQAQTNAQTFLSQLFRQLGFPNVEFIEPTPVPVATSDPQD